MLITEKGQVTIPVDIREQFGFLPHSEIELRVQGKQVVLHKVTSDKRRKKGNPFEVLVGIASGRMTTDEIMALTRGTRTLAEVSMRRKHATKPQVKSEGAIFLKNEDVF